MNREAKIELTRSELHELINEVVLTVQGLDKFKVMETISQDCGWCDASYKSKLNVTMKEHGDKYFDDKIAKKSKKTKIDKDFKLEGQEAKNGNS